MSRLSESCHFLVTGWRHAHLPRNKFVTSWRLPRNICCEEVTRNWSQWTQHFKELVPVNTRLQGTGPSEHKTTRNWSQWTQHNRELVPVNTTLQGTGPSEHNTTRNWSQWTQRYQYTTLMNVTIGEYLSTLCGWNNDKRHWTNSITLLLIDRAIRR